VKESTGTKTFKLIGTKTHNISVLLVLRKIKMGHLNNKYRLRPKEKRLKEIMRVQEIIETKLKSARIKEYQFSTKNHKVSHI